MHYPKQKRKRGKGMSSTDKKEKLAQLINIFVKDKAFELELDEKYIRELLVSELKLQSKLQQFN